MKIRSIALFWTIELNLILWMDLFKEFPDRFMIGSDEFFAPAAASRRAPQSFEETWRIIPQLPDDLAQKIARDNAVRIYNLGGKDI